MADVDAAHEAVIARYPGALREGSMATYHWRLHDAQGAIWLVAEAWGVRSSRDWRLWLRVADTPQYL